MIIAPTVLLISTTLDFATDFICLNLHKKGTRYLRLNRDQLGDYEIRVNPIQTELRISIGDRTYVFNNDIRFSVYYRAPTFLRETFSNRQDEEAQLFRSQWAAFVRMLVIFEKAKWVNHPGATYQAEMKPFQLMKAAQLGFKVPETWITNIVGLDMLNGYDKVAIKSLDTAILDKGEEEAFIYTTLMQRQELATGHYNSPFFLQQGLVPKTDIRVTVVRDRCIAIAITADDGVDIDWRQYKGGLQYAIHPLPNSLQRLCLSITHTMSLVFSAIDLVLHNGDYYFIELNPTGEWAWLQQNTGFRFDDLITQELTSDASQLD